ncbi:MAG: SDR family NAD(P)-dependent oxidoreductase [Parahaliea sp.]
MATFRKTLVTGSGRGIGAGIVRALAAQSVEILAFNRSREPLEQLIAELGEGANITPYFVDVTDFEGLDALLTEVCAAHPDIDLAILNAGLSSPQRIQDFDWRVAKAQIDTNLTSNYVIAAHLLPKMLERGEGRFAVVSSLGAYAGCPYEHVYNASKAGARLMVDGLRAELLDSPVGITGIFPGFVATEMVEHSAFDMPYLLTVEDAAQTIVDGLQRGDDEIAFPRETTTLVSQVINMSCAERAVAARQLMNNDFSD